MTKPELSRAYDSLSDDTATAWRRLPAAQQPDWPDPAALHRVTEELRELPPLVFPEESDRLRVRLAAVARGEAILLQGGDCAETFDGTSEEQVRNKYAALGQMAASLADAASAPVVTVGRIAGQYSKPRSRPLEVRDGVPLPVYRGDAVNGTAFTAQARTPDPQRLKRAYHASAVTLNLLRGYTAYGACGTERCDDEFFTSHEALILDYESALTRTDPESGGMYGSSGHMLWIGERTRQPGGAHIEFASRIRNPIGVKLGPEATADDALDLIDRLDPDRKPGRLTFISRMGAGAVREVLPDLVEKITASGAQVVWVCDPMHGNTFSAPSGHKTRRFADILDETTGFFEVHRDLGTHPGGIHLEFTGEPVTECVGGTDGVTLDELCHRYDSACDPRLNRRQALELAAIVADHYR
ncbi:3-deoxy-7-phosphoheptulonate synthase [Streptomyces sp. 8N616]|uniref:3-deoxy-7-phosphoheptulonate synthase n=1 Tax=Streptomyces sp. 8N616 TaxID=3457414 RepID=UPI003FCF5355